MKTAGENDVWYLYTRYFNNTTFPVTYSRLLLRSISCPFERSCHKRREYVTGKVVLLK